MFVGVEREWPDGIVVVVDGVARARLSGRVDDGPAAVTSEGRWIVARRVSDRLVRVVVDGVAEARCDRDPTISNTTDLGLATSRVGDRYAYRCARGGQDVLVLDGREIELGADRQIGDLGHVADGERRYRPDLGFSPDGLRYWYHAVRRTAGQPRGGPGAHPSVGLVIDGELAPLPGAVSVVEVTALAPDLLAVVTDDSRGPWTESLRLLGRPRCLNVPSPNDPVDTYALRAGADVCLSRESPFLPWLLAVTQDGSVTYEGLPVAR
jgi:hypothetical protein